MVGSAGDCTAPLTWRGGTFRWQDVVSVPVTGVRVYSALSVQRFSLSQWKLFTTQRRPVSGGKQS